MGVIDETFILVSFYCEAVTRQPIIQNISVKVKHFFVASKNNFVYL